MFFTVYQTTNLINNKIYIGTHITEDPNDEYLGSGIIISKAIIKYKPENFKKEILFVFDNEKDMFDKEYELVNETWILREDTYNIKLGGDGGWDHVNKNGLNLYKNKSTISQNSLEKARKVKKELLLNTDFKNKWLINLSKSLKGIQNFKNHRHSEETKKKIGFITSFHQKGEKNSQFGTMWITNGKENKKIKKEELDEYIKLGYNKGRKMKF